LKKEVEWDRSVGDDRSTTGESSSDYRHPHEPVSRCISLYFFSFDDSGLLAIDTIIEIWFMYVECSTSQFKLTFHLKAFPIPVLHV
jgi:hypothetical protein